MKQITATSLWFEACNRTIGGNEEEGPTDIRTVFGGAVLMRELDTYGLQSMPDRRKKVAAFLHEWADAMDPDTPSET